MALASAGEGGIHRWWRRERRELALVHSWLNQYGGAELGVDPMSLYKHVDDNDALLDGLAELTCLGVPGTQQGWHAPSERELLLYLGQALPPGTPPHLAAAAIAMCADCDPDGCFDSGLELILHGVRRLVEATEASRRPRTTWAPSTLLAS